MLLRQPRRALRGGDQANECDLLRASLLEVGDRSAGGAAGSQHRVDQQVAEALRVGRELPVVANGLQRLLVSVEAQVADPGPGNEPQHPFDHAQPRPQYGHDHQKVLTDATGPHLLQRRLEGDFLTHQAACGVKGHQECDLRDKLPYPLVAGMAIAHEGQLVFDQRMLNDGERQVMHLALPSVFAIVRGRAAAPGRAPPPIPRSVRISRRPAPACRDGRDRSACAPVPPPDVPRP